MDISIYKNSDDHSVAVSQTKNDNILLCCDESEKRTFYTKCLIVDRLTNARLIETFEVGFSVHHFYKNKGLQETKLLELKWT